MNERLEKRYNDLPEDQKRIVQAAVERHERACRRTQCETDPLFFEELLNEVAQGREIFV